MSNKGQTNNYKEYTEKKWTASPRVRNRDLPKIKGLKVYVNDNDVSDMYDFVIEPGGVIRALYMGD
ncbi:hypothetical protein LMB49_10690 [Limosilactobacillus reuteri]|uniref:hypothetical protein n=1 Tax=Limosilactobacillus reuteri TaxID=1598 RepID=UPI001E292E03|nr:hypothetical protein [Limosilactobacillus reuteri]MCC4370572.1 hypothetical protein [Limosilactobacillus reuteri]MCC4371859.1 hypothetical protein [Limosilactobacillus reuteri]MCC4509331.1 hypothetical protein [Limosilactobacillus reuteri]MCC4509374.1 hypothetical protein [Limosilactobacillus reuteri]